MWRWVCVCVWGGGNGVLCITSCVPEKRAKWQQTLYAAEHMSVLPGLTQHLNPSSHLMPVALVCRLEEKWTHLRAKMYVHWYEPALLWWACDLGLDCGVLRAQREGKPGPNWVPFTGPWLGCNIPNHMIFFLKILRKFSPTDKPSTIDLKLRLVVALHLYVNTTLWYPSSSSSSSNGAYLLCYLPFVR